MNTGRLVGLTLKHKVAPLRDMPPSCLKVRIDLYPGIGQRPEGTRFSDGCGIPGVKGSNPFREWLEG